MKKIAQKDTSLLGLFKLMEVLLAQGDLAGAQTCRADIISKESPHISDRCKFLSMQLNLALNGKTWFDIDSTQTAKLTEIYLNNPETAIYARNVLAMVKGLRYEKYPFDIVQVRRGIAYNEKEEPLREITNKLKVYPNPASDFSTVEIKLDETITNAEFIIYNLLGSKVYSQQVKNIDVLTIDTKELNNGIYLYVLKTNNEIIEKQKVIISK
ncbi:MAG: T9SS type A sorting domain-containing protein [Bacteroidia bacterium]|nr:T9SS type A sorting domain-containing protein [Bacteroidia bacterium]